MSSYQKIITILEEAKSHVTKDSDTLWAGYESGTEFRNEIDGWIERLKQGDTAVLEKIEFAFLPTSSFQEHSVSNGWGEEYLKLSEQMDQCLHPETKPTLKHENGEHKIGCWRLLFAVLIAPYAFFVVTMIAVDGGSYDGAVNALFLMFFIPTVSYVFARMSIVLHEMLMRFVPFRNFWLLFGVRSLLLSAIPLVIIWFSKENGLQYSVTIPEEGNRTIKAIPAAILFALWFFTIYPIVNYVEDKEPKFTES